MARQPPSVPIVPFVYISTVGFFPSFFAPCTAGSQKIEAAVSLSMAAGV